MSRLTTLDVRSAIRRLAPVFPPPRDADHTELAEVWFSVLSGLEAEDLQGAVDALLREHTGHFPKPAQVRAAAWAARRARPGHESLGDLRSQYLAWEANHADGPCPVCGARLDLQPNGRYAVLHDAARHRARSVPWVGLPHLGELEVVS